jgi:hypothetical protein
MVYAHEIICEVQRKPLGLSYTALRRRIKQLAEARGEVFCKDLWCGALDDCLTKRWITQGSRNQFFPRFKE